MLKTKQCKHGKFTFYDNDRYIGRQLDVLGYYSENEVQTLLGLVTSNSIVVDVGANIGAITVPLARKAAMVYAFEVQPEIDAILRRNAKLNRLGRKIVGCNRAVGAKDGWVEVPRYDMDAPDMNTGAIPVVEVPSRPWPPAFPADAIIVEMAPLDDLIFVLDWIDLIKIDVEGMEGDVIRGAKRIIEECQPILYVENNVESSPEDSVRLIRQIMDLGYEAYWHLPILERLVDGSREILTLSSNMLCVPPSRPVAIGGPDFWPINSPNDNWQHRTKYAEAIARCGNP